VKDTLADLVKHIAARRKALLKEYSEYDLHQLRVTVRRLRTFLRFEEQPQAWQLRREWGYLISHTNPARDWDTLAARIEDLPDEQQPVGLLSAVERHREAVLKDVILFLHDKKWDKTRNDTEAYLDLSIDKGREPTAPEQILDEASARVNAAWERARARADARSWHKLRIAVKDLRYSLDTVAQGTVKEPIELCKLLQKELGTWHDSIIHRDLLKIVERELAQEERSARAALVDLETELFDEGMKCLKEARHMMGARAKLLERGSGTTASWR
jgi:CHAD domain-containing protein